MLAGLGAESAADAGRGAGLLGRGALVLVDAGHVHAHPARTLGAQLDDVLRAGLGASAAGGALLLVDDRKTRLRVHREGTELAGGHAVAAAQAAERAGGVSAVERGLDPAGLHAIVFVGTGTVGTGTVAADDGDLRGLLGHGEAEDGSHLLHHLVAAHRTVLVVQIGGFDRRIGEGAASGEAAAAAVGARHHLLHFVDPRIFLNPELARHPEEDEREQQAQDGQNRDGPDNSLCHYALMLNIYSFLSRPRSSQSTAYQRATAAMATPPASSSEPPAESVTSRAAAIRTSGST